MKAGALLRAVVLHTVLLGSGLLAGSPTTFAKVQVKLATVAPANTPWADTLAEMKKRIESESQGEIQVKTYLGGQLGGEIETLQGIRRGRIEGGGLTAGALASSIPELDVLELPYLFESYEEADYVLDRHLFEPFKKIFEAKGLILVSWAENGWRNIGSKGKAILKPEDLKGVKIRSQESKAHLSFWKALGANPVAIPVPEVLPALQTGLVTAFDNTALFTLSAEWNSAIDQFSTTEHIYQAAAVVYGRRFWDKLTEEQRKILTGPGNGLAPESRKAVRAVEAELFTVISEAGAKVHKLSPSQREPFRKIGQPLHAGILKSLGGESKRIYELVQEGKEAFRSSKK